MFVFLGLVIIAIGIVRLAFPNVSRALNRFSNDWQGVETKHGEMYELNRILSGIAIIVAGIVLLYAA